MSGCVLFVGGGGVLVLIPWHVCVPVASKLGTYRSQSKQSVPELKSMDLLSVS